jgi:uncharacterized protein YfiM (DUF2279 family)
MLLIQICAFSKTRKIILSFLLICVFVCGLLQSPTAVYAFDDKAAHFCLSAVGTILLNKLFNISPEQSFYVTISAGLGKEIHDNSRHGNSFDWEDFGADIAGAGLGYFLIK